METATLLAVIVNLIIVAFHYGRTTEMLQNFGKKLDEVEKAVDVKVSNEICQLRMEGKADK